jgi:glycosyltransferase involved in cell wall biosynthesis
MRSRDSDAAGQSPTISVVIPTHGGRFVAAAVESVRAQSMVEWELIVVDDGSRDGTASVLASYAASDARIRVVTHRRCAGIVAARNDGLCAASETSRYVAFLDHDDVWMPTTLEILLEALAGRPNAVAAHGQGIKIDEDARPLGDETTPVPSRRMGLRGGRLVRWTLDQPTEFANLVVEDCIVSVGSGLIRRDALNRVGPFDPRAERAEDYDLWVRLSRIGPIAFVDRVVLGHRLHDGQTSRRPPAPRGRGLPYVRHKMIASPENSHEQHAMAIAGYRARQRQLLAQRGSHLASAWARRDVAGMARNLAEAAACVANYLRGRPWSWHR